MPPTLKKIIYALPGLLGLSAIALGAIGAHAVTDAAAAATIEKASFYQLIHAVVLLVMLPRTGKMAWAISACWLIGIMLFSGSLYSKAFGLTAHAPLAPMGGMLLMLGWALAAFKPCGKQAS